MRSGRGTPRRGAPGTVGRARDEKARIGVAPERLASERARASARGEWGTSEGALGLDRAREEKRRRGRRARARDSRDRDANERVC